MSGSDCTRCLMHIASCVCTPEDIVDTLMARKAAGNVKRPMTAPITGADRAVGIAMVGRFYDPAKERARELAYAIAYDRATARQDGAREAMERVRPKLVGLSQQVQDWSFSADRRGEHGIAWELLKIHESLKVQWARVLAELAELDGGD